MGFFESAIGVLQTLVIALGGGLAVWGGINLMEGYGQDMVTDVYSHIIDEDRRANAMLFEDTFYKKKESVPEEPQEGEKTGLEGAEAELLGKILSNPEAMALLRALTKTL